tara:strand:- start:1988 stop:2254 length:267 start_codon:yes stop_codon:yes gene_type:complete
MLANIIYFTVFIILVFVLSIAVKAITRGVEAKQTIKENGNLDFKKENESQSQNQSSEIVDQIKELKKLNNEGILSEEEFKKAKDKILK